MTDVLQDGQWAGQPAFVVGGGASLAGFDPERLRGKGRVLACNMAWLWPVAEIAMFKDQRLVRRELNNPHFGNAPPIVVLDEWGHHVVRPDKEHPHVYYVLKNRTPGHWGRKLSEGIAATHQTGLELVNLCDILGCSPIYLLGFDLNAPPEGYHNFHSEYPPEWKPRCHGDVFNKWLREWFTIKDQIRGKILNLNPGSSLHLFPKMAPEEVL